jgi:uncharacterized protein YndB with AHSA1/START domain
MNPADAHDESLVYEFDLEAPIDKVWHALTNPQLVTRWMLPAPSEPAAEVELQIATCRPPHSVTYRWRAEDEPESLVTFELRSVAGGTHLRLTHQRATSCWGPVAMLMAA